MTVRIAPSCTACGVCLATCPTGALSPAPGRPAVEDARCTDCLACIEVCPADAIEVGPAQAIVREDRRRVVHFRT
ncbi:MAG TPA: 4Fe-4S dicluster domain-containing protein [Acidimicrobiales bacterium]|nr:4Fe-4S dicluster domain-containing protein [Acidimicrobiales bacterium]